MTDVTLNPITPTTNGAIVTASNPLPVTVIAGGGGVTLLAAADAGSTDDYAITLSASITAYTTFMQVIFKANTANTGAATLAINGMAAKTIVKAVSTTLANNDILASMICFVVYDGTNFVLMNPRAL